MGTSHVLIGGRTRFTVVGACSRHFADFHGSSVSHVMRSEPSDLREYVEDSDDCDAASTEKTEEEEEEAEEEREDWYG